MSGARQAPSPPIIPLPTPTPFGLFYGHRARASSHSASDVCAADVCVSVCLCVLGCFVPTRHTVFAVVALCVFHKGASDAPARPTLPFWPGSPPPEFVGLSTEAVAAPPAAGSGFRRYPLRAVPLHCITTVFGVIVCAVSGLHS